MSSSHDHWLSPAYLRRVQFGASCTEPSPGSRIRFWMQHTTQPLSSSMTYHSQGNSVISSLIGCFIVVEIHSKIASRPCITPKWCSMYVASSVNRSAHARQSL